MKDSINILFTSAGRRVSLIRSFKHALDKLGIVNRLVAADMKANAPALFVADRPDHVPRVTDPSYIERIETLCELHEIDVVIPLIDPELPILAAHRARFAEKGVTLLVSDPDAIVAGADKRTTFEYFRRIGASTPTLLDFDAVLQDPAAAYPFLLKPSDGSSSVGVTVINNAEELRFFRKHVRNAILQPRIVGQEYTLDVLADLEGKVRCVVPRARLETRAGEVSKGMTVKDERIMEAGAHVVSQLPGARGCITVQCFVTDSGSIEFIEINPRFGGGFPLSYAAGADYPGWICQMILGHDPEVPDNTWKDGLVMLRYDDAVFVDKSEVT